MKYLKTYESKPKKANYKIGDYVLLDMNKIKENNGNLDIKSVIPPIDFGKIVDMEDMTRDFPYGIEYDNNDDDDIIYVKEEEIIRKLTSKEIEVLTDVKKYNL